MNQYYALLAHDIARDRELEAAEYRRDVIAAGGPARPGVVRRGLASGLALVSRSSAAAVRRLDSCVADDLTQALATGK